MEKGKTKESSKDHSMKSWTLDEALQFNIWYNELLERQKKTAQETSKKQKGT